jgi:hypothetical protein
MPKKRKPARGERRLHAAPFRGGRLGEILGYGGYEVHLTTSVSAVFAALALATLAFAAFNTFTFAALGTFAVLGTFVDLGTFVAAVLAALMALFVDQVEAMLENPHMLEGVILDMAPAVPAVDFDLRAATHLDLRLAVIGVAIKNHGVLDYIGPADRVLRTVSPLAAAIVVCGSTLGA